MAAQNAQQRDPLMRRRLHKAVSSASAGKPARSTRSGLANQTDYLSGKSPNTARKEFFYFSDDGDLQALRYEHLKIHFMIQEATGLDLSIDPGERGQEGRNFIP